MFKLYFGSIPNILSTTVFLGFVLFSSYEIVKGLLQQPLFCLHFTVSCDIIENVKKFVGYCIEPRT